MQDADLPEADQHGRCRNAVGVLEADDLIVGDAATSDSDLLKEVAARDEEGAGRTDSWPFRP